MTIYAIRKRIIELFGAFTKPSHGCIHPAIKKLKAAAMVSVQEILSEGGKKSTYYSITDRGKKYFSEIMLEDFGENPSVSLNELNIRIAAMGALSSENRKLLKDKCIKYADLYSIQTERVLKDEYNGLDNYQKELMLLNIQNMKNLISLIEKFNI